MGGAHVGGFGGGFAGGAVHAGGFAGAMHSNAMVGGFRDGGGFRGHGSRDHDFGHRFGVGYGGYYPYYDDYAYDDSYYDDGSCYVVQRRVHTTHGWRYQPVQVCN